VLRCGDDFASKHPKIATMFGLSAETKRQVKQIVEALMALFVASTLGSLAISTTAYARLTF
jgi:hypothetical protein